MYYLIRNPFVILTLLLLLVTQANADVDDVISSAEDALSYSRHGIESDSLDDLKYYARKAMSASEDAQSEADDSDLEDAASRAEEAHDYARKAYYSEDREEGEYYLEKAKSAAEDAISEAEE